MQLELTPLPDSQSKPLLSWLKQPQFETLIDVLQSRALEHEFAAMKARSESEGGTLPGFEARTKSQAFEADVLRRAISILQQYRTEKTKPTTAIIRPTTTHL